MDATKWRGEQAIRFVVVNRNVWGGNRTWLGAKTLATLMSVTRNLLNAKLFSRPIPCCTPVFSAVVFLESAAVRHTQIGRNRLACPLVANRVATAFDLCRSMDALGSGVNGHCCKLIGRRLGGGYSCLNTTALTGTLSRQMSNNHYSKPLNSDVLRY